MGYKKYSPFLKSMKILILISFMYFTSRLDALEFPITFQKFDYQSLPVYCAASTRHFECKAENGTTYCLPEHVKCSVRCANDAELNCKHAKTECEVGEYKCKSPGNTHYKVHCIHEQYLCDGRSHCPDADDENPSLCNSKSCGADEFACLSPGHCIQKSRRCDGRFDCKRFGLNDTSDEMGCSLHDGKNDVCNLKTSLKCANNQCAIGGERCDGHPDCEDGSDEAGCPRSCGPKEIECDNKCIHELDRCDGVFHCSNGTDEIGCEIKRTCPYVSDFPCRQSGDQCVSSIFRCDGTIHCAHGEDEICLTTNLVCSRSSHFRCHSGSHCVHKAHRCDGTPQCPDGSDELNCPTKPPPMEPLCAAGLYQCANSTNDKPQCIDINLACSGKASCSQSDPRLTDYCKQYQSMRSPCRVNNGGCAHKCSSTASMKDDKLSVTANCSCHSGWTLSPKDNKQCIDVNECESFGSCQQMCLNTNGSYNCSCRAGYVEINKTNCVAPGAAKFLYSTDTRIIMIDSETGQRNTIIDGLQKPKYIAYDVKRRLVFFHTRDGNVASVRIDGTGLRVLATNMDITALAYDWMRQLLFYTSPKTNELTGHVGVINVTTGANAELLLIDCPHGLAANPTEGYLYVTKWCGEQPGIYKLRMDGTILKLVTKTPSLPAHLTLDLAAYPQRMYWVDTKNRTIISSTLLGNQLQTHVETQNNGPSALTDVKVFENKLYWSDLKAGLAYEMDVVDSHHKKLFVADKAMISIGVYHSILQPKSTIIGGCSSCKYLCIAKSNLNDSPSCLCYSNQVQLKNGDCRAKNVSNIDKNATPEDSSENYVSNTPETVKDEPKVMLLVGLVILVLLISCTLAGYVAYRLRCQEEKSISFGSFHSQASYKEEEIGMPKVNSRTPLTEHEIEVEPTRF